MDRNTNRLTMTISFTLDPHEYADVKRWLEGLPKRKRSTHICEALREHITRGGVTIGDVYQVVKALERKIQTGVMMTGTNTVLEEDWNEPPDAAANLDTLGKD